MAKFNKEILGKVQGALGDVTFRQRNGKTFLSTRPGSFTPGTDENSIARRDKFSLSVKLASTINAIPELKKIWEKNTPSGLTTYNHIMRTNYVLMGSEGFSGLIKLIPSLGFNVANPVVTLSPSDIKINLGPLGSSTGIDVLAEVSVKIISISYLSGPVENSLSKNSFLTLTSGTQTFNLTSALEFIIPLSDVESQMLTIYQTRKSWLSLVTLDAAGNVVHYSNTFSG